MGIYTNGNIFGISIYNFHDDIINILYKKKYDLLMNKEELKEAFLFYNELSNKDNILFKIYTECISTYDNSNKNKNYMDWYPISLNMFLEKFGT